MGAQGTDQPNNLLLPKQGKGCTVLGKEMTAQAFKISRVLDSLPVNSTSENVATAFQPQMKAAASYRRVRQEGLPLPSLSSYLSSSSIVSLQK